MMKYIKIFEKFGDKLYQHISEEEMVDMSDRKMQIVSEFDIISDIILNSFQNTLLSKTDIKLTTYGKTDDFISFYIKEIDTDVIISKLIDDYYLVILDLEDNITEYYKCDELEGLKQFISSLPIRYSIKDILGVNEGLQESFLKEIKYDELEKLLIDRHTIGIQNELASISKIIHDNLDDVIEDVFIKYFPQSNRQEDDAIHVVIPNPQNYFDDIINIYKIIDDYYLITLEGDGYELNYKCDTIEGVKEFFNNIKNNYKSDSIKESYNNDYDLFSEITPDEYNKCVYNMIQFNDNEILNIYKLLDDFTDNVSSYLKVEREEFQNKLYDDIYFTTDDFHGNICNCSLFKIPDDYYLLSCHHEEFPAYFHFKIDTFDGIKPLLQHLLTIVSNKSDITNESFIDKEDTFFEIEDDTYRLLCKRSVSMDYGEINSIKSFLFSNFTVPNSNITIYRDYISVDVDGYAKDGKFISSFLPKNNSVEKENRNSFYCSGMIIYKILDDYYIASVYDYNGEINNIKRYQCDEFSGLKDLFYSLYKK